MQERERERVKGRTKAQWYQDTKNTCPDCDKPKHKESIRCRNCNARTRRQYNKRVDSDGYIVIGGYREHPNSDRQGKIREHTLVMSEFIGRALLNHEEVHHKNGNRADNRIENLELWSTHQPKGQRVQDKLVWAREIIALYEVLTLPTS